jgi:hypothetical protein
MQQPAVQLTEQSAAWLTDRLEGAYALHGRVPSDALAGLDWPDDA